MTRPGKLALAAALAVGCATSPAPKAPPPAAPQRVFQGTLASGPEGGFETGRLLTPDQSVPGPFVLTYLAPGASLVVVAAGGAEVGAVSGPLGQPFHLAPGASLRLAAAGDVVYAGIRPMPVTRALEAHLGRAIWLSVGSGQPEQWTLREIGADHVTVERSRSYRVIALRRIAEIDWTDLTGADPTPRIVLSPE
jgi:hypothetical protein